MHLAVCDDNIADRKQMERLLGRESDRRLNTTGVLYVDSFGNRSAILSTPMIYDGLFMDMVEDGCNAAEIARELRNAGNTLPIVFCCSKINYREETDLPDNCFFMEPGKADGIPYGYGSLLSDGGRNHVRLSR